MMTIETMLRVQIHSICLLVLIICYTATKDRPHYNNSRTAYTLMLYHLCILAASILLITDSIGWIFDGMPGRIPYLVLTVSHTLYYSVHTFPAALYILYADSQMKRSPERSKIMEKVLFVYCAAAAAASLLSPVFGWFFTVDQGNTYIRGEYFNLFAASQFLLLGLSFFPAVFRKRRPNTKIYWTLMFFPAAAVVGAVIQYFVYGLVIIWPVTTVFIVAAGLNIQKVQIGMDHLTGLYNRMTFDETLNQYAVSADTFGCILLDLDGFKTINDTFGHDTGDRALEDAAEIIRREAGHDGTAARYGGDEFALLLPNADENQVTAASRNIKEAVEAFNTSAGRPYTISVSMGCKVFHKDVYADAESFISEVDAAMYEDKRRKKLSESGFQ